jgi:hypothetical protein
MNPCDTAPPAIGSMAWMQPFFTKMASAALLGIGGYWNARPILTLRTERREAIHVAERHGFISRSESDDRLCYAGSMTFPARPYLSYVDTIWRMPQLRRSGGRPSRPLPVQERTGRYTVGGRPAYARAPFNTVCT